MNTNVNKLLNERQRSWFYGVVKENQQPPPMLVVRYRSGNQTAYCYHFMSKHIAFNPSEGITLQFIDSEGAESLKIEGRNLTPLWEALTSHRVTFIREAEDDFEEPDEEQLFVEKVRVTA